MQADMILNAQQWEIITGAVMLLAESGKRSKASDAKVVAELSELLSGTKNVQRANITLTW